MCDKEATAKPAFVVSNPQTFADLPGIFGGLRDLMHRRATVSASIGFVRTNPACQGSPLPLSHTVTAGLSAVLWLPYSPNVPQAVPEQRPLPGRDWGAVGASRCPGPVTYFPTVRAVGPPGGGSWAESPRLSEI